MSKDTVNHMNERSYPDGGKSIVYGENVDENGRITDPHGHITTDATSTISYARRPEDSRDKPLYDPSKE